MDGRTWEVSSLRWEVCQIEETSGREKGKLGNQWEALQETARGCATLTRSEPFQTEGAGHIVRTWPAFSQDRMIVEPGGERGHGTSDEWQLLSV